MSLRLGIDPLRLVEIDEWDPTMLQALTVADGERRVPVQPAMPTKPPPLSPSAFFQRFRG